MNKKQFINTLKGQLKGIPEKDVKELIYDYEEHFSMGINEGRLEEEIASSLGNPKAIAKEIKADYMISKVEESFSISNFFRALLATLGLGFFNIVFILGPFIGFAASLFAFFISGFAIVISGIAIAFSPVIQSIYPDIVNNPLNPIVSVFLGIFITALGLLWSVGCYYLNKGFYILTVKYLKLNLNIIVNRRNKND